MGERENSIDSVLLNIYLSELFIQYVQNPRDSNIESYFRPVMTDIKHQQEDIPTRSNLLSNYHKHIKDNEPFDYKKYRAPELVWLCIVLSFSQQEEDRELIRKIYEYARNVPSN